MQKIIKVSGIETTKQVLITIERGETSDSLRLQCWHESENGPIEQRETIECEDAAVLHIILNGFTKKMAEQWAGNFDTVQEIKSRTPKAERMPL